MIDNFHTPSLSIGRDQAHDDLVILGIGYLERRLEVGTRRSSRENVVILLPHRHEVDLLFLFSPAADHCH